MSLDTQKAVIAVITALKADVTLNALVAGRVYTNVVQNASFPYIAIRTFSIPYDTKDTDGTEVTLRVQAFSEYKGSKEIAEIMSATYNALHKQSITVTGANLVNLRYDGGGDANPEPDGKRWQGFIDFRVILTN